MEESASFSRPNRNPLRWTAIKSVIGLQYLQDLQHLYNLFGLHNLRNWHDIKYREGGLWKYCFIQLELKTKYQGESRRNDKDVF
jgi:hypothetical protein